MLRLTVLGIALVACLLTGCVTTTSHHGSRPDLAALRVGKTQQDVYATIGKPAKVATSGNVVYLQYGWDSPFDGRIGATEEYFVRLVDGMVESFGEKGDFDSTKDPTINISRTNTTSSTSVPAKDLYTELTKLKALLDAGAITPEEYGVQKRKLLEE